MAALYSLAKVIIGTIAYELEGEPVKLDTFEVLKVNAMIYFGIAFGFVILNALLWMIRRPSSTTVVPPNMMP